MTRTAIRTLLTLLVVAGVLSTAFAPAANAAPTVAPRAVSVSTDGAVVRPLGVPANAKLVKASMSLDCAHLSSSAKKYADAHGYCPSTGTVQPYDSREGDCGVSYLYMWDNGGGYAGVSFGVGSYMGEILHISSYVSWTNWSYGNTGTVDGSGFPWSDSYDRNTETYTAAGFVTGAYSGSITLIWGGSCTILIPTDSTDVSW